MTADLPPMRSLRRDHPQSEHHPDAGSSEAEESMQAHYFASRVPLAGERPERAMRQDRHADALEDDRSREERQDETARDADI